MLKIGESLCWTVAAFAFAVGTAGKFTGNASLIVASVLPVIGGFVAARSVRAKRLVGTWEPWAENKRQR